GWGVGVVLFGIGINRLGMSLGFSIILGLGAALGSLIPMLVLTPGDIATRRGIPIVCGLMVVLVGIYLRGKGSGMKDPQGDKQLPVAEGGLRCGVVICVLAGVLIAMFNLSFVCVAGDRTACCRAGGEREHCCERDLGGRARVRRPR